MHRLSSNLQFRHLASVLLIAAGCLTSSGKAESKKIDFNFQVRPILSDRCFKCHGPDPKSRKADLRLDTAEDAHAVRGKQNNVRAIFPGHPEKSEIIRRILSDDPDDKMPPPNSHLTVSPEEASVLRKWIEEGATYQTHWAFNPVTKPKVPQIRPQTNWCRNPIDQFVYARLQTEHLRPAQEASRETLIRRLSFNLTGLPPSLKEIDDFVGDTSADAYDRLVDRLLSSKAYGERMAEDWLDLARYADTYGYQSDVERDMSAWRDWVIRAFNQNLSYDKFVSWQVAGDMLPDASDEQILATAFNRLHRQTNEGGSIEDEFRTEYVADRVHTFGTAFLGLTLECARCHDHKYDPIKQKDYYSLFAFFNNIDESGLYSHFTKATPSPTLLLYREGEKSKHAALKKQINDQEQSLLRIATRSQAEFKAWLREGSTNISPLPFAHFTFDSVEQGKSADISGKFSAVASESPQIVSGHQDKALQFNGENSVTLKGLGHFGRTDRFSFSLWLRPTEKQERAVIFHHSKSWTDSGSRGYGLLLEKGYPSFSLAHFWPGNAIGVKAKNPLPLNEWSHLTITYDGSSRAAGIRMFVNGQAASVEVLADTLYKDIVHRAEWGDSDVGGIELTLAARFRDAGFKNGIIDDFQIFDRDLTEVEAQSLFPATPMPKEEQLFAFYLQRHSQQYLTALTELKALREAENKFVSDIPEIMVMKERTQRRATFVLKRGSYDAPGDAVEPNTPENIFRFPKNLPRNRLGLAQWVVDPKNPLTARVIVNRVWKMHFGQGLVATPENFGSQGKLPSHPELLDWLAQYLIDSGWDLKALHTMIVSSATFRQSSVGSLDSMTADPENHLLSRGPKMRLQAEAIRDAALSCSGLLSKQIGGPSVKPYQPSGLWEQAGIAKSYQQDSGEKLYRRSLYTFWRRTLPPPSMTVFDATSREVCTARRETTSTPLQSLVLLNDPQFVEAARVLAQHSLERGMNLENTFRIVLGRQPTAKEVAILQQLYSEQLALFSANAAAAEQYLANGEFARNPSLPTNQLAALTVLVNTLMNHDEFVTER